MERYMDLKEATDGRLYSSSDMVKAGCRDCTGCSACCRESGDTILLDPLDWLRLETVCKTDAKGLLEQFAMLRVADGLILPYLKIREDTGACSFLSEAGRCRIHEKRPGFCRLYPLGRYYHDRTFSYILQIHECRRPAGTKVKIKKWIGEADIERYEQFALRWHYLLKDLEKGLEGREDMRKPVSMFLLQKFYLTPFSDESTFYEELEQRVRETEKEFCSILQETSIAGA